MAITGEYVRILNEVVKVCLTCCPRHLLWGLKRNLKNLCVCV